jgi:hypothetical protein
MVKKLFEDLKKIAKKLLKQELNSSETSCGKIKK